MEAVAVVFAAAIVSGVFGMALMLLKDIFSED